jgi:hypothetical protein
MLISIPVPTALLPVLQPFGLILSNSDRSLSHVNIRCAIARLCNLERARYRLPEAESTLEHTPITDGGDRTLTAVRMPLGIEPLAPMHLALLFAKQFWNMQHPPSPENDLKIC